MKRALKVKASKGVGLNSVNKEAKYENKPHQTLSHEEQEELLLMILSPDEPVRNELQHDNDKTSEFQIGNESPLIPQATENEKVETHNNQQTYQHQIEEATEEIETLKSRKHKIDILDRADDDVDTEPEVLPIQLPPINLQATKQALDKAIAASIHHRQQQAKLFVLVSFS
jgi:nitrate reductase cytochrome c-type subunit